MDIVVIRGNGDHPAEDIVDPLMSEVGVGLSRGRAELDQGALADEQQLDMKLMDIRIGELVEIDDSILGNWRGKVTSTMHSITIDDDGNLEATTRITVRKPR